MRLTTSDHIESTQTLAGQIWPSRQNWPFRPNLNIALLEQILREFREDHFSPQEKTGKRKSSISGANGRASKRSKTSDGVDSASDSGEDLSAINGSAERQRTSALYPILRPSFSTFNPGNEIENVPILQHVLQLQYTGQESSSPVTIPDANVKKIWREEDDELLNLLQSISHSISSPTTYDLGRVDFGVFENRWVALRSRDDTQGNLTSFGEWLFLVPRLAVDPVSNGYNTPAEDLLFACRNLRDGREAPRARLDARLRAVILPPTDIDCPKLPISLHLELTFSFTLPYSLRPIQPNPKRHAISCGEGYRRLLRVAAGLEEPLSPNINDHITVSRFYAIMGPAPALPTNEADLAMQPAGLEATLLPFQRRSVAWLLEREGKTVNTDGSIVDKAISNDFTPWTRFDAGNHSWWFNRLTGALSVEEPPPLVPVQGGILAEEPGLGKTLETIALILLNPSPPEWNPSLTRWDPETRLDVKAVKTTLIVTPSSLATQWKEEIHRHAPSLKVLVYDGWSKLVVPITNTQREMDRVKELNDNSKAKKLSKAQIKKKQKANFVSPEVGLGSDLTTGSDGELLEWCNYVHQFDIVITTFQILRSDFNIAKAAPQRPRREDVVYSSLERPRSPLVMIEWKRVIMDEVQMVGGGRAEDMVALIPRLSSFAVSGTPARAQLSDLIHVLRFLRIDRRIGDSTTWLRLLKPGYSDEFSALLQRYAVRTLKANVAQELTIPSQTRYLVGVELGRVERHVYDQAFEAALLELGLDARGVAATEGWQVNGNTLRAAIRRLRGICTHPQVGQLQRRDGLYKPGALKSIEAVLESMKDQNWRNLLEDSRSKLISLIRFARLEQRNEQDTHRHQHSLETLIRVEKESLKHLEELQVALEAHDAKGKALKEEAARLRQERTQPGVEGVQSESLKGKGKERETDVDNAEEDDGGGDPENMGLPKTIAGEEHRAKRQALQARIREAKLAFHQIKFLQGDAYHVLGKSTEEDAAYAAAEKIRRELLRVPEVEANKAIALLGSSAIKRGLSHDDMQIDLPNLTGGGIRSTDLMDEFNTLIEDVLNEQSSLLWEWRTYVLRTLSKPLNPQDEVDGEEYQRSLDNQGEAEAYLQAYAALLADRREALLNERTLLAAHDVREKRLRHTQAAIKAANTFVDADLEATDGIDLQPEHEVVHKELSDKRKALLKGLNGRAIRSILVDLIAAGARLLDKDPEKPIIKDAIDNVRRFIHEQTSLQDKLDADLALVRKAFNQRILYFRQLQEISDSVADVVLEDTTLGEALQACVKERNELEAKINTLRARQRYLDNLVNNREEVDEDDKACILCRGDFIRGYITQCAHIFCEDCMKLWLTRKDGKTCPVCRVMVGPDTVQRFTVNIEKAEPPPQVINGEAVPSSHRRIEYNVIDPELFREIESMETYGDFGTKIQTLVRHLLYLQLKDPGAKSIVFSAWADSLLIVEYALRQNGIKCLKIDQKSRNDPAPQVFRNDPEMLVLLLHGERETAGLNVTCASRVFLLESVVHHSFELQAIARIDRLGQSHQTEVYCYYAEDTIERNILDLAARKGLSLYTKDNSQGTVNVSSFTQDDERDIDDPDKRKTAQKGDFIYKVDDMLAILFPHMFEDVEYLLPLDAVATDEDVEMIDALRPSATEGRFSAAHAARRYRDSNAVAGPSHIRR